MRAWPSSTGSPRLRLRPDDSSRHVKGPAMKTKLKHFLAALFLAMLVFRPALAEGPKHRVGYVASTAGPTFEAFRKGMREAGYEEGRDFILDARFTEGRQERFPGLIDEVLRGGV